MTLGILGGGQLGRMSVQAAQKLGIRTVIYTPEDNSPAAQVADHTIVGAYEDQDALLRFAEIVDIISYEFENIPLKTVGFLKALKPVYPDENLLKISQDRVREKSFLNSIGIPTARWWPVDKPEDIPNILKDWNQEDAILKTTRLGYDGKGQARFNLKKDNPDSVYSLLGGSPLILEEMVDFTSEISVIAARDHEGQIEIYGPVLNEHRDGILHKSVFPAPLLPQVTKKAVEMTFTLAEQINLRGVLALELFVMQEGIILANEIAPRPHNSGHWSIEACAVSQFENHVRAVCGLPVLRPGQHRPAEMINLIGDDITRLEDYKGRENVFIHDYGKSNPRPGRKMGHVTILM